MIDGEQDIRDAINRAAEVGVGIRIEPGQLPAMVDKAEEVLVRHAEKLKVFQRAGSVMRIIAISPEEAARTSKRDGLERSDGAVVLHPLTATALLEIFDRLIMWEKVDAEGEVKVKDCPSRVATTYLSRVGFWKLPFLTGVIEAPILRPDGSVLSAPGYDLDTGLFLDSTDDWPAIPETLTPEDAKAALEVVKEPFAEFPFVDDADRSVVIAGILTALQRRLLWSAPLFGFSAPAQRSGKSLLVECIGIIATGRIPAAAGVSKESEELRKAITSTLREGHLIAHLDNIIDPLDSPDLARALTQLLYGDRLLGTNTNARFPTNVVWMATGNNLTFRGDMSSRSILCRIDAQVENPEEREFAIADLRAHLFENRKALVTAALTILRAYHLAGRPRQPVKPWGGFDQWSREIREAVVWVGLADPCITRSHIAVSDPEREIATTIITTWHTLFPNRQMLLSKVIAEAQGQPEFKQHLLMVAASYENSSEVDARRLGAWCRSREDRVYGGLTLKRGHAISRAQTWEVSSVRPVSSKQVGRDKNSAADPDLTDDVGEKARDRTGANSHNPPNSHRTDADDPSAARSSSVQTDENGAAATLSNHTPKPAPAGAPDEERF